MKNYIVSLSKRALLLSGALAIFTACDDGDLGDIYKGNSSGEYVIEQNRIFSCIHLETGKHGR